jgi:RNA polymerase sigma-70 factor (ECF subfamily)
MPLNREDNIEYQELVLANINAMYNLSYRMTLNAADAQDLVQEAALKGLRYFPRFEKGSNFKAWILTIVRTLFINQYRKRSREPQQVSYDDIEGFVNLEQSSGFQDEVFGEHLQRSLDDLPEEMRSAVTLFYVEGLSYREIADVMRCPVGTVMSRLHAARQLLKKKYSQYAASGI